MGNAWAEMRGPHINRPHNLILYIFFSLITCFSFLSIYFTYIFFHVSPFLITHSSFLWFFLCNFNFILFLFFGNSQGLHFIKIYIWNLFTLEKTNPFFHYVYEKKNILKNYKPFYIIISMFWKTLQFMKLKKKHKY